MQQRLIREMAICAYNLLLCSRFLIFQPVDRSRLTSTSDQIVLINLFYGALLFVSSYLASLPNPEFNLYGLSSLAITFGFIALSVYAVTKLTGYESIRPELVNVILGICFWFYLLWFVPFRESNFSAYWMYDDNRVVYLLYNAAFLAVLTGALVRLTEARPAIIIKGMASFILLLFLPLHVLQLGGFWYEAFEFDDAAKTQQINQEDLYYRQFHHLTSLEHQVLPGRSGITDLYFVGFGSYAGEDVFMKEVDFAKNLFDERFDTRGRSVGLINNPKTIDTHPIASRSNLERVLMQIGNKMNVEEDVLFLYLTSHGSKSHQLSVEFRPLDLNTINPPDLKTSLDNAGIKWRVLLISACYSGGFVDSLKNDYTLVMTASAPDRTSFGCGSKSEFTYFGKAVFDEQLQRSFNFVDAFESAVTSIQKREAAEKRESSRPQLVIGERIRAKLEALGRELAEFDRGKHM